MRRMAMLTAMAIDLRALALRLYRLKKRWVAC